MRFSYSRHTPRLGFISYTGAQGLLSGSPKRPVGAGPWRAPLHAPDVLQGAIGVLRLAAARSARAKRPCSMMRCKPQPAAGGLIGALAAAQQPVSIDPEQPRPPEGSCCRVAQPGLPAAGPWHTRARPRDADVLERSGSAAHPAPQHRDGTNCAGCQVRAGHSSKGSPACRWMSRAQPAHRSISLCRRRRHAAATACAAPIQRSLSVP